MRAVRPVACWVETSPSRPSPGRRRGVRRRLGAVYGPRSRPDLVENGENSGSEAEWTSRRGHGRAPQVAGDTSSTSSGTDEGSLTRSLRGCGSASARSSTSCSATLRPTQRCRLAYRRDRRLRIAARRTRIVVDELVCRRAHRVETAARCAVIDAAGVVGAELCSRIRQLLGQARQEHVECAACSSRHAITTSSGRLPRPTTPRVSASDRTMAWSAKTCGVGKPNTRRNSA